MNEERKRGLGKGLNALLGEAPRAAPAPSTGQSNEAVRELEIARIQPNPDQPRKSFQADSLAELAASIERHGVLQPILVRPAGENFQIIAGERRWRAAQKAQLHTIPAIIRNDDEQASAELALIENVQREDLNAIEEAAGYQALIEEHGHSQEKVGKLVGKSRSHVANLLRLLDLPSEVQQMILQGDINMGHARAVANAPDPLALAQQVVAKGLSVRQAEQLARDAKPEGKKSPKSVASAPVDADIAALERQLGDMLGLKVKVAHSGKGGTVVLNYASLDQLDMICQRLSGEKI